MNPYLKRLEDGLAEHGVRITPADYDATGFHADLVLESNEQILRVAEFLKKEDYFLVFVTACHTDPTVQILYQFGRFETNFRIMVRAGADENNEIPTISDHFRGADWHERETRDFFGVTFAGHPNLVPLILDESDRDLKPLLKGETVLKSESAIFGSEVSDV